MISVCMATYNGENYVKEQILSILKQLSEIDEVIVSDDGSTDKTLEILKNINDKRIKVYSHQKEKNPYYAGAKTLYATNNFENALSKANGDIIFLSDQDDVWYDNKVKDCLDLMNKYDFVMSNYTLVDDSMKVVKERAYLKPPFTKNLCKVLLDPHMPGCCFCFKKDILDYALPFPKTILAHDLWIGAIAIKFFNFFYYENPLIFHRAAPTSGLSSNKSDNSFINKLKYRFFVYYEIKKIRKNVFVFKKQKKGISD